MSIAYPDALTQNADWPKRTPDQLERLRALANKLITKSQPPKVEMRITFDRFNPRAYEFARRQSSQLITEVGKATKEAVRVMIGRAFDEGLPPEALKRLIRERVGLRSDQIEALDRYEEEGASPAQVDAYRRELLNDRAILIGRTETMRSANAGQKEMWGQAQAAGELPVNVKRIWIGTDDGFERPEHIELNDQVVGLNEPFAIPSTGREVEPGEDPNCRCGQGLVDDEFISNLRALASQADRRRMIGIATQHRPAVARTFLSLWQSVYQNINQAELTNVLEHGNRVGAERLVLAALDRAERLALARVGERLLDVMEAAGEATRRAAVAQGGWLLKHRSVHRAAGGPGSGNFGHSGRPGEVGGSTSDGKELPKEVYHGTTSEVLEKIGWQGLWPAVKGGADAWLQKETAFETTAKMFGRPKSVYVAPSLENAFRYADMVSELRGKEAIVLRIEIPVDKAGQFRTDEQDEHAFRKEGTIPADWIKGWLYKNKDFDGVDEFGVTPTPNRAWRKLASGEGSFKEFFMVIPLSAEEESNVKSLGGPGSGNFGHAGRPGERGGSGPGGEQVIDLRKAYKRGGDNHLDSERQKRWERDVRRAMTDGPAYSYKPSPIEEIRSWMDSPDRADYRVIEKAMEEAPKFKGEVFRGVKHSAFASAKEGDVVTIRRISSASRDPAVAAKNFTDPDERSNSTLLVLKVKSGMAIERLGLYGTYRTEREVVIPRGRYKVTGIYEGVGYGHGQKPSTHAYDYGVRTRNLRVVELQEL